jgi:hypothetical protein
VTISERIKGTASKPRVNREELRRERKARTMLRSKGEDTLRVTEVPKVTDVTKPVSGRFFSELQGI